MRAHLCSHLPPPEIHLPPTEINLPAPEIHLPPLGLQLPPSRKKGRTAPDLNLTLTLT